MAAETSASGGSAKPNAGGESKAAQASASVSQCQRLKQENEELAASADVAKGKCVYTVQRAVAVFLLVYTVCFRR